MRHHLTPSRTAGNKAAESAYQQGHGKLETSGAQAKENGAAAVASLPALHRARATQQFHPKTQAEERRRPSRTHTHPRTFIAEFATARKWKRKCPSAEEWLTKTWNG